MLKSTVVVTTNAKGVTGIYQDTKDVEVVVIETKGKAKADATTEVRRDAGLVDKEVVRGLVGGEVAPETDTAKLLGRAPEVFEVPKARGGQILRFAGWKIAEVEQVTRYEDYRGVATVYFTTTGKYVCTATGWYVKNTPDKRWTTEVYTDAMQVKRWTAARSGNTDMLEMPFLFTKGTDYHGRSDEEATACRAMEQLRGTLYAKFAPYRDATTTVIDPGPVRAAAFPTDPVAVLGEPTRLKWLHGGAFKTVAFDGWNLANGLCITTQGRYILHRDDYGTNAPVTRVFEPSAFAAVLDEVAVETIASASKAWPAINDLRLVEI